MPKSVAIYLPDLSGSGAEWAVFRLARGLVRRRYAVSFVVAERKGALLPLVEKEFEIVALSARKTEKRYNVLPLTLTFLALARFLKTRRPDILLSSLPLPNVIAGLANLVARRPSKVFLIEPMMVSGGLIAQNPARRFFKRTMIAWVYSMADAIIAVSKAAAKDLEVFARIPADKISVIYSPVLPDDFSSLVAEVPDHPWFTHKDKPLIVAAGRLHAVKGFDVLIEAMALLRERVDARLVIIGEGDERSALQALIEQKELSETVALIGYRKNIFPYMKAADLFALSSRVEAMGNVLVEALACGLPVVATDCGGPAEILEDDERGLLIAPENSELLATALETMLGKKKNLLTGWARLSDFSTDVATRAYDELMRAALSENSSSFLQTFFQNMKAVGYRVLYGLAALRAKDLDEGNRGGGCLVVAPHPDDDVLGCGGVIQSYRERGLPVHIVYVTDGSASSTSDILTPATLALLRQDEAIHGAKSLGSERDALSFFGIRDGRARDRKAHISELLAQEIALCQPSAVFAPFMEEEHDDHKVIAEVVADLKKRGLIKGAVYYYPIWWHWKRFLISIFSFRRSYRFRRLSLKNKREAKRAALREHRSQCQNITKEKTWKSLPERFLARFFGAFELFLEE